MNPSVSVIRGLAVWAFAFFAGCASVELPQRVLELPRGENNPRNSEGAFVVSKCECLPLDRLELFASLAGAGLPVIFTDSLPEYAAERADISDLTPHFKVVNTDTLTDFLRKNIETDLSCEGNNIKWLRFYHVSRGDAEIYLFSNESVYSDIDARIKLKYRGECLIYDPWDNKIYRQSVENGILELSLEKGNMIFVVFGVEIPEGTPKFTYESKRVSFPLTFDISVKNEGEEKWRKIASSSELFDISAPDRYPDFSGDIMYEAKFTAKDGAITYGSLTADGFTVIDLGQVGETAQVWLNGTYLGARITSPYKFSLRDALANGENHLKIVVKSNLAHKRRDFLSTFIQIPPTGILGDIAICKYE